LPSRRDTEHVVLSQNQDFQLGEFGFSIEMTLPSCMSRARTGSGAGRRGRDDSLDCKKPVVCANADWLRKRIRTEPFTLPKLTWELAARGNKTDVRAEWTFVHADGLS